MKIKNILIAGLLFAPLCNLRTASDPERLEEAARISLLEEAQRKAEANKKRELEQKATAVKRAEVTQSKKSDLFHPPVLRTPSAIKPLDQMTEEEFLAYALRESRRTEADERYHREQEYKENIRRVEAESLTTQEAEKLLVLQEKEDVRRAMEASLQPSALAFDEPAAMMASEPLSARASSAAQSATWAAPRAAAPRAAASRAEEAQSVQQSLSPLGDSLLAPNSSVQATGVYKPFVVPSQEPIAVVPAVASQVPTVVPADLRSADEELAFALREFDRIEKEISAVKQLLNGPSVQAASVTQPDVPSLPGALQQAMTDEEEAEAMARLMTETAQKTEIREAFEKEQIARVCREAEAREAERTRLLELEEAAIQESKQMAVEQAKREEAEEREFELAKTQSEIATLVEAKKALLKILVRSEKDQQKLQEWREKLLIAIAKLMSLRPVEVDMEQSYIF